LDCLLKKTKDKVLDFYEKNKGKFENIDPVLNNIAGYNFHNRSKFDFDKFDGHHDDIAACLSDYINGFSTSALEIFEYFSFEEEIGRLNTSNILYKVIEKFREIDLADMDSMEAGYMFEELIRKFSELSNETAGEHFTPREVIRLMVNILFNEDNKILAEKGTIKSLYDPACGTGGMLSVSDEYIHELNPDARLELFGQEINPASYATCKSDMLIKSQNPANIKFGNTFTIDGLEKEKFDYMLSNPPFGVAWNKYEKEVKNEYTKLGHAGRFGAGLPRISDGSLLFLQHMISKMKPEKQGSRIGIVFNGSPLFTGSAGSGESDIRKWIVENDWLETIIAMPDQLFYNTGISTYVLIVTNKKSKKRKGKIQLINATSFSAKMRKSLGNKRNEITPEYISKISQIYGNFSENEYCKIFPNEYFGYAKITVERPLLDEKGKVVKDKNGNPKPDAKLRDNENVPLSENIETYFKREVLPHVPDAWIDHDKTKIGYEFNFNRYFYEFTPLRKVEEIMPEIIEKEQNLIKKLQAFMQNIEK
jgi:type I restriction enzyme M protein